MISLIQGISSQLSIVPAQKGGSHLYRAIVSASQSSIGKNKASAAIKQDLYTIAEDILLTSFLEVVHLQISDQIVIRYVKGIVYH